MQGLTLICVALLSLGLSGCAGTNPVKSIAQSAGIGGEPKPAPDFVTRTRQATYEYQPIGRVSPKRRLTPRDAEALDQAEADMDSARTKNEARGAATRRSGAQMPANDSTIKPSGTKAVP